MHVKVIRSNKRRKTVELRPTSDGVRISIPANATKAEEERYVRTLLGRYSKRKQGENIDLRSRALLLASRYGLQTPSTISWSTNQNSRWGSCTSETGSIRISSSLADFPLWVIDYVIVHELVHLSVHGHGPRFWQMVERYPRAERARGFLIAKGLEPADQSDDEASTHSSDE